MGPSRGGAKPVDDDASGALEGASETASDKTVELPSGRCQYDVLLTSPGGEITKVLEGNVIVKETVSL